MDSCMALATAFAEARPGGSGPKPSDVADAAFALADLRRAGWDVQKGLHGLASDFCADAVCKAVAADQRGPATPDLQGWSARVVGELRNLAFDFVCEGAVA